MLSERCVERIQDKYCGEMTGSDGSCFSGYTWCKTEHEIIDMYHFMMSYIIFLNIRITMTTCQIIIAIHCCGWF